MTNKKKNIVILGSTGSIGCSAIEVIKQHRDKFSVSALAAGRQIAKLAAQSRSLGCKNVICAEGRDLKKLRQRLKPDCRAASGCEAMIQAVCAPEVDMVLCAIIGTGGLLPVMAAIKAGKDIALASKEVLVMAGDIIMAAARESGSNIIPVDSEHCAIFQCLESRTQHADISRLILTSSGGPFRNSTVEEMDNARLEDVLNHPVWDMGKKITIDSATMMNKALEIVEAKFLFDVAPDQIDVVIHPESIVHSLVEFIDGTLLAQLSSPNMCFPIQYALSWPEKYPGMLERLDLAKISTLRFHAPDRRRFPALDFAYAALNAGGTAGAVLNAANEVAVDRFIKKEIKLTGIWKIIEKTMTQLELSQANDIDTILAADAEARSFAAQI